MHATFHFTPLSRHLWHPNKSTILCPYVWRMDVWRGRDVSKEVKLLHWLDIEKKENNKKKNRADLCSYLEISCFVSFSAACFKQADVCFFVYLGISHVVIHTQQGAASILQWCNSKSLEKWGA